MKSKKKKELVLVVCCVIVCGIIGYAIYNKESQVPNNYPDGGLSQTQDAHKYKSFNGLTERITVEDYVIDVPSTSIQTTLPAYLYNIGTGSVLCVTEIGSTNDLETAVLNSVQVVDPAVKSVKIVSTGKGFLNGFNWDYVCATAGDYSVTTYKTHITDDHDMTISTIINSPTDELIRQGVVVQQGVIGSISKINVSDDTTDLTDDDAETESITDTTTDTSKKRNINGNPYLNEYDDFQKFYDNEISQVRNMEYTQQYNKYVMAEKNYDHMRITVNWINTYVTPWELRLFDRNEELEYSPVEMEEGKYVFIVDDVPYGEEFIVYFSMSDPGSICIQQEEEADYEAYYNRPDDEFADFKMSQDESDEGAPVETDDTSDKELSETSETNE